MKIPQSQNQGSRTGKYLSVNMFGSRFHLLFLHVLDVMRDVPVSSLRYVRMGECALVMHDDAVMMAIDLRDPIQQALEDTACIVVGAVKNGDAVVTMGFIVSDGEEFMGKLTRQYGMDINLTPNQPGPSTPRSTPLRDQLGDR